MRNVHIIPIFFLILFPCAVMSEPVLTIFYAGEEQGQLGLHGCGNEQVGGLAHRHTLISNLYIRHPSPVLNMHTGNLIDATDPNAEWVYQMGLSALKAMEVDVLCLGPNELSLSSENLASIHANYPEIVFICTNSKSGIEKPYLIQTVDNVNVAVVNLISLSHAEGLPNVSLKSPQNVLAELKSELVNNSDVVVVVFHGTQEKAHTLSEANYWIDVVIVAGNRQRDTEKIHRPFLFRDKMALVTNVSEGAAVGVLEVSVDSELERYIFTNSYHGVSEEITPNVDLAQLIAAGVVSRTKEAKIQLDIAESEIVNRFNGFDILTLTFVSGIEGMRSSNIAYLLLYTLMFIVPLLVCVQVVFFGGTTSDAARWRFTTTSVTLKVAT